MGDRRKARRTLRGPGEDRLNPYRAIGLARNPFATEEAPGVPTPLWIDRGLTAPPAASRTLFQVLGPRGAGKTAHLLHWRERHPGPYRHVPLSLARWRPPPLAAITYWDEADRLPSPVLHLALRRAARRGSTIVVGTHRDLDAAARGAGLAVVTHVVPTLDETTLAAWIEKRVAATRIAGGTIEPPRPSDAAVAGFVAECDGSFRRAADRLHAWMAARAEEG